VSVREVFAIGDPVLRRPARELSVEEIGAPEIQRLIDDLIETKRATHGAGIAAIEPVGDETVEINEGCLSVPDLRGNLERHLAVRVRYFDRDGVARDQVKRGLTAGTYQHEVDHLDGILFVDRADPRGFATWEQFDRHQRDAFLRRVDQLTKEGS
jgi:peptide deformylase